MTTIENVTVFVCECGELHLTEGEFEKVNRRCAAADDRDGDDSLGYHAPVRATATLTLSPTERTQHADD